MSEIEDLEKKLAELKEKKEVIDMEENDADIITLLQTFGTTYMLEQMDNLSLLVDPTVQSNADALFNMLINDLLPSLKESRTLSERTVKTLTGYYSNARADLRSPQRKEYYTNLVRADATLTAETEKICER